MSADNVPSIELMVFIQNIMNDPALFRNARGQLKRVLSLLNDHQLRLLALSYTKHILWIGEAISHSPKEINQTISNIEKYLNETLSDEAMNETYRDWFRTSHQLQAEYLKQSFYEKLIKEISYLIIWTLTICCGDRLASRGLRHLPVSRVETMDIANSASKLVGMYTAGPKWNSTDKQERTKAKALGQTASLIETEWQLSEVVRIIETKA